ncbi:MAG: peptidoglycan-N-acetylglucosamine deacetylase [Nocardioidaceae bacterium]|nr:peptidoglycan-N-acetylglucosamine deacetylase [Nocardioidaceae bacterium]
MLRRLTPVLGLALVLGLSAPAEAIIRPDVHCSKGRVAVTFDDGPSKVITPKLLKVLRTKHAQVTFFVQGHNVKRYPKIVRAAVRDGHAVEDHSWDHPDLTKRSSHSVNRQLTLTKHAIQHATGRTPGLFRPPYGATSKRVRHIAAKRHLRQELWTIDTRDWSGISAKKIRKRALKGLRPHHANVILMHDAVGNSPRTLKAVPGIIHDIRKKGYCLVPLQQMMPLGKVSAADITTDEGTEATTLVPIKLQLDGPSQRRGTVRLTSVDGSAVAGTDFDPMSRTVTIRRGARSVTVHVRIHPDPLSGPPKAFTVQLGHPHAVHLSTTSVTITLTDAQQSGSSSLVLSSALPSLTLFP